jgi:hypothetical protein
MAEQPIAHSGLMEHTIYLATCIPTRKRYIGRTSRPLHERIYMHFWNARRRRRTTEFHHDLVRYGEVGFRFEVIMTVKTNADLQQAEIKAIAMYAPEYNRKIGASGANCTVDRRATVRAIDADLDGEIWRPIIEFDGKYEVSDLGRVRSVIPRGEGMLLIQEIPPRRRILKQTPDPKGHVCVSPQFKGAKFTRRVHVLVAETFIGPRAPGIVTRHKDGDYANPRLDNLEYGTMADNMADRERHGRTARGDDRHGRAKLTTDIVRKIRKLRGRYTQCEMADMFGVTHQSIQAVLTGKSWSHVE